jgi:hypothetical protein
MKTEKGKQKTIPITQQTGSRSYNSSDIREKSQK